MMQTISSASNPLAKRLKSLSDAKARKSENAFLVEGEVMIIEALDSGLEPAEALFENETALSARLLAAGADVRLCPRSVLESVCDTKTPQGCCASFSLPENGTLPANAKRLIALDDVQDPGNVGTILRTADAAGFEGAILGMKCADVYSPKVQRSAMGSGFRVKSTRCELAAALKSFARDGYAIVVSALDGEDLYSACLPKEKFILVIGNEACGVSAEVKALSSVRLKIPMRGKAESLNAAVAAGILMYELTKPT